MYLKKLIPTLSALVICSATCVPTLNAAEEAGSLTEALSGGKTSADFRLRIETVDQDGGAGSDLDASAITLRTLLTYETLMYKNWFATLTFENNSAVFDDANYNSTVNGEADDAVIADPEYTEIDQIYVTYAGFEGRSIQIGKQVINHGNQRHVGAVGWRQNRQTFDAARVICKKYDNLTLDYAFVTNANRIFSDEHASNGNAEQFSHFLHAAYKVEELGTASGYLYLLDFDQPGNEGETTDSSTIGLRFEGNKELNDSLKLGFEVELASQSDYADRTDDFSAMYSHLCAGITYNGIEFALGYEVLGSDDGSVAFQTPHATGHKFNGWADKFLGTPADGLEDFYLRVGGKIAAVPGLSAKLCYHTFSGDDSGDDFGSELDIVASYKFQDIEKLSAGCKYAAYAEDGLYTDTNKLWLWSAWAF